MLRVPLAAIALLAIAPLASACPTTSPAVEAGPYYVVWECNIDVPDCDSLCASGAALVLAYTGVCTYYVYSETNGIPGLQRSDPHHDDTCGGEYPADSLSF